MQVTGTQVPSPDELRMLCQGGEEIECFLARRRTFRAEVRHGRLETVRSGSESYAEVRLRRAGRLHRAAARRVDWTALLEEARCDPGVPSVAAFAAGGLEGVPPQAEPGDADAQRDVTAGALQMGELLGAIGDGFLPQATAEIARVERRMANSLGLTVQMANASAQMSGGGRAVQAGDFHSVQRSALAATALPDAAPLAAEVAQRYAWGRRVVDIAGGRYPVVLGPSVLFSLLNPVLARLSAPALLAGTSPWADRIGEAVLSPLLSIHNDPSLPDGPRRGTRDDEATATSLVPLVDAGHVAGYVVDREAAARLSLPARGTAYGSEFGAAPTARPGNLSVLPGEAALRDLLGAHRRLLLLEGWIGAQPTNPLRGDMAGNAVGLYLVEDGEVVGRIKNAVVSLNAFDALGGNLAALGRRREWVAGGMLQAAPGLLPHALIQEASLAVRG